MQFVQHRVLGYSPFISKMHWYFLPDSKSFVPSHMLKLHILSSGSYGKGFRWLAAVSLLPDSVAAGTRKCMHPGSRGAAVYTLVSGTAAQLHPSFIDWEKSVLIQEDSRTCLSFQIFTVLQIFLQFMLQPLIL